MLFSLLLAPSALAGSRPATVAEIEAALIEVTRDPVLGARVTAAVARQLQDQGPLALTDGFWVVPIDTGAIVSDEGIHTAIREALAPDGLELPVDLEQEGLAFLPANAMREFDLSWDFDHYTDLAEAALEQQIEDIWPIVAGLVIIGAATAYAIDYCNDSIAESSYKTGYLQGRADLLTTNDPNLDSDNDGTNNRDDPDDDNDKTPDYLDAYPFNADKQICDLCGRTAIAGLGDSLDTFLFTDALDSELFTEALLESITAMSEERAALLPLP